jgi:hypothetical protein
MTTKSITHNFKYTKEDIENLIKGDIARQLEMETIPIISYSIEFDIRYALRGLTALDGVNAKVEVPG